MDGIININKEKGFTSHDVVAKMRRILHTKKIGHTGTLDPDATGVLPVCVGKATRVCSLLENHDKTYRAVLLLGMETDTQDTSGKVLREREVTATEDEVRAVFEQFKGPQMQIPPMYSALKVNGKKLYEYAREGKVIEREPRPIEIFELEIEEINLPEVRFTVSCSKGTYIRTLCNDIGEKLGCLGCMKSLSRIRVGNFLLEDALTLGELEEMRDAGVLQSCFLTIEDIFADLPREQVDKQYDLLIHNGNRVRREMFTTNPSDGKIRVYDSDGIFIGIYEYDSKKEDYKPLKMFL